MSGHSKWSQIKRQKGKTDANRGKAFTKAARDIIVAVREGGGGDPAGNFRLRTAIERAKEVGAPNENIERAIQKGLGSSDDGSSLEAIQYEGYGPDGVAVLIEALTDNRNRTAGDIRSYFYKYDGTLGETGCVGWMFEKKGVIAVAEVPDFDQLFMDAAGAGAEDIYQDEELVTVLTRPDELEAVAGQLAQAGYQLASSEVTFVPANTIQISETAVAKKLLKMLNLIEDHDDVQNVYSNFEIDELILAEVESLMV